jgi:hypothetical protein
MIVGMCTPRRSAVGFESCESGLQQNLRANPPDVVPDEFVRWCQGE